MKTFKSIVVVKHPLDDVWNTMRDRMPEVAARLDDIEEVTVVERQEEPDGIVRLVNLWKGSSQLPTMLGFAIDRDLFAWTDHASWNPKNRECHWRIVPKFLPDRARCTGTTRFEPAMGGRGTRLTFEGELEISAGDLAIVPSFLGGTLSGGIESLVTTMIPKNFRKIAEALSGFLEKA